MSGSIQKEDSSNKGEAHQLSQDEYEKNGAPQHLPQDGITGSSFTFILINSADPQTQSWPVVITIFACGVCTSVRPSPLFKISQNKKISSGNSDRYW